jgi:hypothetical protein
MRSNAEWSSQIREFWCVVCRLKSLVCNELTFVRSVPLFKYAAPGRQHHTLLLRAKTRPARWTHRSASKLMWDDVTKVCSTSFERREVIRWWMPKYLSILWNVRNHISSGALIFQKISSKICLHFAKSNCCTLASTFIEWFFFSRTSQHTYITRVKKLRNVEVVSSQPRKFVQYIPTYSVYSISCWYLYTVSSIYCTIHLAVVACTWVDSGFTSLAYSDASLKRLFNVSPPYTATYETLLIVLAYICKVLLYKPATSLCITINVSIFYDLGTRLQYTWL